MSLYDIADYTTFSATLNFDMELIISKRKQMSIAMMSVYSQASMMMDSEMNQEY